MWGDCLGMPRGRRAMTLGRAFIACQEGRDRFALITMYLDDDRVIVLAFETGEQGRFEMLNWVCKGGPNFAMTKLEMIAKVWAETAWNNSVDVGFGSNTIAATPQESAKMLQTWTSHADGENLVAMESPGQAIAHIHQRGEAMVVDDSSGTSSLRQGGKDRHL
jgi:hypothetical protein